VTLPIRTDRLIIRRFTFADIDDIIAITAHPSVARETTNIPREDRAKMTEYIETQSGYSLFETQACVDLACELKETGEVIGLLSLVSNGKRQGEIGWGFSIDHRGRARTHHLCLRGMRLPPHLRRHDLHEHAFMGADGTARHAQRSPLRQGSHPC